MGAASTDTGIQAFRRSSGKHPSTLSPHHLKATSLFALTFAAATVLRLIALGSDPYTHLDWSAGLLTDEGFYIHNARNVAIFGHARTDEFNNMLVSPLLHYMQIGMFSTVGVGAMQARLISVLCSLLTLLLFYAALRRAFGQDVALVGAALLGLDHAFALFNRMALMDTPATFFAVAALYAFVRAEGVWRSRGVEETGGSAPLLHSSLPLLLCGLCLGAAVLTRSLCAYLIPAPFIALYVGRNLRGREGILRAVLIAAPVLAAVIWYGLAWYVPNLTEIVHMNRYYALHQVRPHSLAQLGWNLYHAVLGDHRGIVPYVFRHSPIVFTLALLALAIGRRSPSGPTTFLVAWLGLGALVLSTISYSPGRYYVPLWPPMCALAAIALCRLPVIWPALWSTVPRARAIRACLAWLLAYHVVEALIHHGGVISRAATMSLLYGTPTIVALMASARLANVPSDPLLKRDGEPLTARPSVLPSPPRGGAGGGVGPLPRFGRLVWLQTALAVLWLLSNGIWLADWGGHIRYTQRQLSRWLAANLPADSVLIGDVAPGICLDNRFTAVNVIPGLCNGIRPVERFAGRPRYVAILDGRWKEVYWRRNYAAIVERRSPVKLARALRWDVGIYAVDGREMH